MNEKMTEAPVKSRKTAVAKAKSKQPAASAEKNNANRGSGNGVYTVFTTIQLHPILWHGAVGGKLRQNVAFKGQ